jgi:hypothetical protein
MAFVTPQKRAAEAAQVSIPVRLRYSVPVTANQRSDLLVTLAFLWGPGILIVALAIYEIAGLNLLVPALVLAGAPYVAVVVWPFAVAFREGGTLLRIGILLGLILLAALAIKLNWAPRLEY